MDDYEANRAVRRHVVGAVTLILDNERGPYFRLTDVARRAVRDDMGTGVGREEFETMLRGSGAPGYKSQDYAEVVGIAVRDELLEILEGENEGREDSLTYRLLIDVLDLHDSAQAAMFGEHYLPESADDVEWDEES